MLNSIKKNAILLMIAIAGGTGGAFVYKSFSGEPYPKPQGGLKQPVHFASYTAPPEAAVDFTKAAEMSVHAVVHVKSTYEEAGDAYQPLFDPFGSFFWGDRRYNQPEQREATGSGVIISDDGFIVTNNHVVQNAKKVEVTLNDKRIFTAKIIGTDPSTDIALLKIEEKGLPFIGYGNSDDLKVGEWVLAVGNPFNLTSTVTAGIVSAKARDINILNNQYKIESFIQTDAAVNPGNSGGALVNTRGELVGINAAIASNTGSYTGYSFAIPVNIVKKVVDDLVEYGEVQRGFLGINIKEVDYKLAEEKKIKHIKGIYVAGLMEGGSAKDAGLREGDVILKVGETEVNTPSQLQEQVGRFRPGDKVTLAIVREDKEMLLPIVLRNKNGTTEVVKKSGNEITSLLGAEFENVSPDELSSLRINGGVRIKSLSGGKLRMAGIKEGFIITHVDRKEITNNNDLVEVLRNKKGGVLIEGLYPNGSRAYYAFGL